MALLGAACALGACLAVFGLRPWAAWPWLSLAAALGCACAVLARVLRPVVLVGDTGFKGVPAQWVSREGDEWTLVTTSAALGEAVRDSGASRRQEACLAEERDARALFVAGALAVLLAPVLWRELHPEVRVINLGPRPLQVWIDGRWAGLVEPTWSEAPNIGLIVRAPMGGRSFEGRDETGERVDFVRGWLALRDPMIYAPAHEPYCLWIEQRTYGTTVPQRPSVLKLPAQETLIRLPVGVDAWFQPNPAATSRDRWFSGGTRRALRFGPCASAPAP